MSVPQKPWRRFERIDGVCFSDTRDHRLARAWGLEDTLSRLRQLGLAA